jgi:hypothetical protein
MRARVFIQKLEDWINDQLLQEIKGYDLFDISVTDETVYFLVYNLAKPSLFEDTFAIVKQQITMLLIYNEDGSDKLPF